MTQSFSRKLEQKLVKRLVMRRMTLDISERMLARTSKVNRSTMRQVFCGASRLNIDQLRRMCAALGLKSYIVLRQAGG